MRRRAARHSLGSAALVSLVLGAGLAMAAPAHAATATDCRAISNSDAQPTGDQVDAGRDPYASLGVAQAQARIRGKAGAGIRVALLDSGIDPAHVAGPVKSVAGLSPQGAQMYFHGTTAAGLIAGTPHHRGVGGIAPGATLLDAPVYVPGENGGKAHIDAGAVARALGALAANPKHLVVVLPHEMAPDPHVAGQIKKLIARGAIVVATTGDRQKADFGGGAEVDSAGNSAPAYAPGEDHHAFPASVKGVVGVTATGSTPDVLAAAAVYASSDADLAAPTQGARSWTLKDTPCVLGPDELSSGFASAIVGGTMALAWSADPGASGAAIVERVQQSASGRAEDDERSMWTGHGVVRPYEAVTHVPAGQGSTTEQAISPATVPDVGTDVLAQVRDDALWWGLIGGGALVLALIMRPLFAKRRRRRA